MKYGAEVIGKLAEVNRQLAIGNRQGVLSRVVLERMGNRQLALGKGSFSGSS
jgi:hypothetical protein